MALQQVIDVTAEYLANGSSFTQDMGDYNTAIVLFVNPRDAVQFFHTNDGGDITGVTDGGTQLATNYSQLAGKNCADVAYNAALVTSATESTISMIKFEGFGRFVKFTGVDDGIDKLILRLYKI